MIIRDDHLPAEGLTGADADKVLDVEVVTIHFMIANIKLIIPGVF